MGHQKGKEDPVWYTGSAGQRNPFTPVSPPATLNANKAAAAPDNPSSGDRQFQLLAQQEFAE